MHLETFVSLVIIVTLGSFPSVLSASIFMPLLHLFVIPVIGISISISVPVSVTYTAPRCCLPLSGFLDDVRVESLPARFIRCRLVSALLLFAVSHHDGSLLETVTVIHNFEGSNVFAPHSTALDSRTACNTGKCLFENFSSVDLKKKCKIIESLGNFYQVHYVERARKLSGKDDGVFFKLFPTCSWSKQRSAKQCWRQWDRSADCTGRTSSASSCRHKLQTNKSLFFSSSLLKHFDLILER